MRINKQCLISRKLIGERSAASGFPGWSRRVHDPKAPHCWRFANTCTRWRAGAHLRQRLLRGGRLLPAQRGPAAGRVQALAQRLRLRRQPLLLRQRLLCIDVQASAHCGKAQPYMSDLLAAAWYTGRQRTGARRSLVLSELLAAQAAPAPVLMRSACLAGVCPCRVWL